MLINFFFSSVLLGIIVAIPPGSVTVVACQRALQIGFRNSIFFSFGSCVSDMFYLFLVYFGVAGLISGNVIFKIILWLICGLTLILLGVFSIIAIRKKDKNDKLNEFQKSKLSTFISGILVTLTNPVTIIGWIAVAGNFFLLWNDKFPESKKYGLISVFLIMIGVLLWFLPMTFAVSRLKKILNERLKIFFILITNCFLIIFGFAAFYSAAQTLLDVFG